MTKLNTIGLLMAGGESSRMLESGVKISKPLVRVLGVPLFERNLHALLRTSVQKIVVSVSASQVMLQECIQSTLGRYSSATGIPMELLIEESPLGNIGCAGRLAGKAESVLVVYADNLTTLDMRKMLLAHGQARSDLTLATHKQIFRMPYGEVDISEGKVVAYREKPICSFFVCSGVAVLGEKSLNFLREESNIGLSNLAMKLIESRCSVTSFAHNAPWIDINTLKELSDARDLVLKHQREFDLWTSSQTSESYGLVLRDNKVLLVPSRGSEKLWSLPTWIQLDCEILDHKAKGIFENLKCMPEESFSFVEFDELSLSSNMPTRMKIYRVCLHDSDKNATLNARWWKMNDVLVSENIDLISMRAIMLLTRDGL